ncbi:unnamed protein product [Triticum turgidum subsp. durum]|uniref:Uncharacterized protein n=1 Tax=Triticum turgidum subsp. durum TaxID=4567 RepID=A0A9R1QXJ8_TRITD|nr:unnamed protein product [Triticum turgidum subsp. durum]
MDTKACVSLVILALLLAGPNTRAAALPGIDAAAAVMQTSSSSMKLEDGVATELADSATVDLEGHRRVLAGRGISASSLNPNKAACTRTCPARGGAYTGRACLRRYQCR